MPHTMPKQPTHRTLPRRWFSYTNITPVFVEKHRPGETGRQLAERLRAEAATPKPSTKQRRVRAKTKTEG